MYVNVCLMHMCICHYMYLKCFLCVYLGAWMCNILENNLFN